MRSAFIFSVLLVFVLPFTGYRYYTVVPVYDYPRV